MPVVPQVENLRYDRTVRRPTFEPAAIFDPALPQEIAVEFGLTIRRKTHAQFAAVGQRITAVDGLPPKLIAEMVRLRWIIEMFFRTFEQLLGCKHLFSDKHNGVELQA